MHTRAHTLRERERVRESERKKERDFASIKVQLMLLQANEVKEMAHHCKLSEEYSLVN